jgi:hypothetical protein
LLVAPNHEVHPSAVDPANDASEERLGDFDDYAILPVDTSFSPLNADSESFEAEMPYVKRLIVPGVSDYSYTLREREDIGRWTQALHFDKNGGCSRQPIYPAGDSSHRCIYTKCQTAPAMSGAPIFSYDLVGRHFFIGGIHLRAGSLPAQDDRRECGDRKGFNVGITLPADVLKIAQKHPRN